MEKSFYIRTRNHFTLKNFGKAQGVEALISLKVGCEVRLKTEELVEDLQNKQTSQFFLSYVVYNQAITTGLPWENFGNFFFRECEKEVLGSRITEGRVVVLYRKWYGAERGGMMKVCVLNRETSNSS